MSVSDERPAGEYRVFGPLESSDGKERRQLLKVPAPYQEPCPTCGMLLRVEEARPVGGIDSGVEFYLGCQQCPDKYRFFSGVHWHDPEYEALRRGSAK